MNTTKRHHLARIATAVLALSSVTTRALAADPFDLNLVQYELRFGQGRTQHTFYLSSFAPGGDLGDLAFGESGAIRMPVYSTNEKLWTPFRNNSSDGSDGTLAGSIVNGILGIASLVAMGYAIAGQAKSFGDAWDFELNIPPVNIAPPPTSSSAKPAKK